MLYQTLLSEETQRSAMRASARVSLALALVAALLCAAVARRASAQILPPFRNFESPQVHPLALTPDGTRLLAVNSPNATLSIFQLSSSGPVLTAEIPVGLEPVSVAARNDREAWVVNWLSDSVSIVDLTTGNVTRTIDVGDEPTDVLFAGANSDRAFVCVSGGPKHVSGDVIENKGTGQVKVFDAANPASALFTLDLPAKQPRALARDAAGGHVFVSVFESGNRTAVVSEPNVRANGGLPPPNPALAAGLPTPPSTSLIVKWNGSHWVDELTRSWDAFIPFTLPDADVFVIDATAGTVAVSSQVAGVGTHVGNMVFDSVSGRLVAVNLEDTNQIRFEPNLRGRFQQSRISLFDPTPGAAPPAAFDLNPHVNLAGPGSDAERAQSLALPADLARASDGTLYVAATSSARVGVLDSSGSVVARVGVGQGPTGLALDEARQRLYVLNRFDQTVGVVDTNTRAQVSTVPVGFNPEPAAVRSGRKILFDANLSAHGLVSCGSCHPGGHRDGMVWDLGNPQGTVDLVTGNSLHPMKGPMMTQSLRAIIGTEPFHWRGDRTNLAAFNPAFVSLLGGTRQLTTQEMNDFTSFIASLTYPPNPNENENRSISAKSLRGFNVYNTQALDAAGLPCISCHTVQQVGNSQGGTFVTGTGTLRLIVPAMLLKEAQPFKIPQLRGINQKALTTGAAGEQVTAFGFLHDGTFGTLIDFLKSPVFTFPAGQTGDDMRRDMESLLLQLDTGLAPSVGMQVTLNAANAISPEVVARVQFLELQASGGHCDIVVRGLYNGTQSAFHRAALGDGTYQPDSLSEPRVSVFRLMNEAATGAELTFTGVPPGTGRRFSIDADGDGILNDDETRTAVSITGRVVDASGHAVAGVAVSLSGAQSAMSVTDATGGYVFNNVSVAGTHIVTPASAGLTFTPASRTFSNPSWNQSATFVTSPTNASDASEFFVTQHYLDFLNRAPDASGLQFWTNEIESCGANAACREVKRVNVSAAFFLSIEFQQTGYLVYLTSKASFGDLAGRPVPVGFERLMTDAQRLGRGVVVGRAGWESELLTNKDAFFPGWVQRPEFLARYPVSLSPADFVNTLNTNAGFPLTSDERVALINQLAANNTTQGRANALRQLAENAEFSRRELNRAFVLMQYFGYLRRNPDDAPEEHLDFAGYNFWLTKLNQFNGNYVEAEMIKAFITSLEYRQRFGQP